MYTHINCIFTLYQANCLFLYDFRDYFWVLRCHSCAKLVKEQTISILVERNEQNNDIHTHTPNSEMLVYKEDDAISA